MEADSLTQSEADFLLKLEKILTDKTLCKYPLCGEKVSIPLTSKDKRETFTLDINRSSMELEKNTYLNRTRGTIILARLDIGGPGHRNPDLTEIPGDHIHIYKENWNDKWAYILPVQFNGCKTPIDCLDAFMDFCNIIEKPHFEEALI
jgi:stalled ribosome rescue protein Dom34